MSGTITLKELAGAIGAEVVGDPGLTVSSVNTLEEAGPGQVSFVSNPKYLKQLETTRASAVIVGPGVAADRVALLKARDPYYAFTLATIKLHGFRKHAHVGVHPGAHVDPTASVGEGTVIYPGVYVGPRARIGRDCILYPNVVVYDDCILGDRVTLHACTSVGHDGFGYATHQGEHHKIPQTGNVVIEDDVEIGANCSIDRATLGSTVIGRGTKFSNGVVIGHGGKVGRHCLFVGQTALAGSATIGNHVTLGGRVGVVGHLKVGDHVVAATCSLITSDVPEKTGVLGIPALPIGQGRRVWALTAQLPELLERIRKLERRVEELGGGSEDKDRAG